MSATLDLRQALMPGITLIEASAGTGKTYTITLLFVRLVLVEGLNIDQILVVTFTEDATFELRKSVRARLEETLVAISGAGTDEESLDPNVARLVEEVPDRAEGLQRLKRALHAFDDAAIHTIHGFCQRILVENAFESGALFDSELVTDIRALRDEVVTDYWVDRMYDIPKDLMPHLKNCKWTLYNLQENIRGHLDIPGITIEPDRDEKHPLPSLEERDSRLAELAVVWRSDRANVEDILQESDALNRKKYNKGVPVWITEMDRLFASGTNSFPTLPEKFHMFAQGVVNTSLKKGKVAPTSPFFKACELFMAYHRDEFEGALKLWIQDQKVRFVHYYREEMRKRKARLRIRSFGDLISLMDRGLKGARGNALAESVSRRFSVALIDEFQDTDQLQYEIFRKIFSERGRLILIGDPKQAIYAFRGADIFTYLRAREDAKGRVRHLDTNWRSDPGYVAAINVLFDPEKSPDLFVNPEIQFQRVMHRPGAEDSFCHAGEVQPSLNLVWLGESPLPGEKGKIEKTEADKRILESVSDLAQRLTSGSYTLCGKPVAFDDIAILVPGNKQAKEIQTQLQGLGIPAAQSGTVSVFGGRAAVHLSHLLAAILEPADKGLLRRALAGGFFELKPRELIDWGDQERGHNQYVSQFANWHALWKGQGFMAMMEAVIRETDIPSRLLSRTGGERLMVDILHMSELMQQETVSQMLSPRESYNWLISRVEDAHETWGSKKTVQDEHQLRLDKDGGAVRITTIHKSKGLEYPIVICPYLWKKGGKAASASGPYHDPEREDRYLLELSERDAERIKTLRIKEDDAEDARLIYVALTRARHACFIPWVPGNKNQKTTLGRLFLQRSGDGEIGKRKQVTLSDLKQIEAEAPGQIALHIGALPTGVNAADSEVKSPQVLSLRRRKRRLYPPWRAASFSSLISGDHHEHGPKQEGRDYDGIIESQLSQAQDDEEIILSQFPRGTRTGHFFHGLFEHLDFQATPEVVEQDVRRRLALSGFNVDTWAEPVTRVVKEVLQTQLLKNTSLQLSDIPRESRLDELGFMLSTDRLGTLTPTALGEIFALHGCHLPGGLAGRLGQLDFNAVRGGLKGFIDLVFVHGERWYLLDYKSNHLGEKASDYSPARIEEAMGSALYYLQYHLYTVALHRFLHSRLPGYDYETHFGGVLYLFLRGMSVSKGGAQGVFCDRPPRALIAALDETLSGARHQEVQDA